LNNDDEKAVLLYIEWDHMTSLDMWTIHFFSDFQIQGGWVRWIFN